MEFKPLTDKERMFVDEYITDLNGTRAWKAVYKNCKSDRAASANASEKLKKPNVRAYKDSLLAEIENAKILTAEELLKYFSDVVRGETKSSVVAVEGVGKGRSVAKIVAKPPDEKEKLKAAELLGKYLGIFIEKQEVSVNVNQKFDDIIAQAGKSEGLEDE